MLFFNLSATYKNGRLNINHYENNDCFQAPECEKTVALKIKAASLQTAANTCQLTFAWVPDHVARDVSRSQPLSCAAFFDFTAEQASASMPEIIDLKWLHIEESQPAETVFNMAGSRVWYLATGRDVNGTVSLGMSEKYALALCGASDKTKNSTQTFRRCVEYAFVLLCTCIKDIARC